MTEAKYFDEKDVIQRHAVWKYVFQIPAKCMYKQVKRRKTTKFILAEHVAESLMSSGRFARDAMPKYIISPLHSVLPPL